MMLTIACKDFVECFSAVADFLDAPPRFDSSLTCQDGDLVLRTEGMEIGIPVQGYQDGVQWISGKNIFGLAQLAKHKPPSPETSVVICDGLFRVGRLTFTIRVEESQPLNPIFVPQDAPVEFWLDLERTHTFSEIATAGLAGMIEEAHSIIADKARRAHAQKITAVKEAAELLAPYAVTFSNLWNFIAQKQRNINEA